MISSNIRLRAFFVSIVTGVVGILPLSLSLLCFPFFMIWLRQIAFCKESRIYIYIWYLIRLNVSSFLPSLSPFLINIHSIHALRIFYVHTSTNRMNPSIQRHDGHDTHKHQQTIPISQWSQHHFLDAAARRCSFIGTNILWSIWGPGIIIKLIGPWRTNKKWLISSKWCIVVRGKDGD